MTAQAEATVAREGRTVLMSGRAPSRRHVPNGALVLAGTLAAAAALGVRPVSPAAYAARIHGRAGGRIAGRLDRWRSLADALADVLAVEDPIGARRAYEGPVRELLRCGVDALPEDASPSARAREAVRVAQRYRALLADRGEIDPAELFRSAAAVARRDGVRGSVAVAGRVAPGGDELAFLDAVCGDGSVVVLGPEDRRAAEVLAGRGWTVREDEEAPQRPGGRLAAAFAVPRRRGSPPAGAAAHAFPSREAEVRWVLGRVRRLLLSGVPAGEIALAVRDDGRELELVEALAWELDVPVRTARLAPLRDTRPGAWIAALAEAIRRGLPYEETLRVLASGIAGGMANQARAAARRTRPTGLAAWRALDERTAALAWPSSDRAGAWRERIDRTLAAFGLADEETLAPADAAVLRTLRGGLASAFPDPDRRLSARDVLRDLDDLLGLLHVRRWPREEEEREIVRLLPLDALAGGSLRHVFVMDAAEGALPAPLRDPPVLDFADRITLAASGLPIRGARELAEDEEAVFAAALRSARGEIVVTYAAGAGGAARLPSPYLARIGLVPTPAPHLPPSSVEERRRAILQAPRGEGEPDPVLALARAAWRIEVRRESDAPADGHDGVVGRGAVATDRPLSATQITELGTCPFRWFVHHALGVREPEEAEEGIPPALRGELWHATLDRAVRRGVRQAGEGADGATVREAIVAALPAAFEDAERAVGVPAAPAWAKARTAEIRTLTRAVRSDDFLAPGAVPVAFERPFEGRWRGLRVRGRLDRVDEGPGGLELIDYKSGTRAPAGAKGEDAWSRVDVQLPLYLEAAADELAPGRAIVGARYLSLRSGETIGRARPGESERELEGVASRVRAALEEGAFPVDPGPRRTACATCDLLAVCRVGPRVDRKRAAREAEPAGVPG